MLENNCKLTDAVFHSMLLKKSKPCCSLIGFLLYTSSHADRQSFPIACSCFLFEVSLLLLARVYPLRIRIRDSADDKIKLNEIMGGRCQQ